MHLLSVFFILRHTMSLFFFLFRQIFEKKTVNISKRFEIQLDFLYKFLGNNRDPFISNNNTDKWWSRKILLLWITREQLLIYVEQTTLRLFLFGESFFFLQNSVFALASAYAISHKQKNFLSYLESLICRVVNWRPWRQPDFI